MVVGAKRAPLDCHASTTLWAWNSGCSSSLLALHTFVAIVGIAAVDLGPAAAAAAGV